MTTVAVGNIRGNPVMRQRNVRHDSHDLFDMGEVVLACEIGLARYDRAFENAADLRDRRVFFRRSAVQVATPEDWATVGARFKLTRGLAGVNPARWLNVVFNQNSRTVYAATHMTNGGWKKGKSRRLWRRRMWFKQFRKIKAKVAEWLAAGWNVVLGGDINRVDIQEFHPRQVVANHAGLMHLYAIPARGYKVNVRGRDRMDPHSDHPFIRAKINFELAA